MLFRKLLALCLLAGCATTPRGPGGTPHSAGGPALVVLISVDQLRADLPLKLMPRFGRDGFRRLYEQGVVYEQAHYAHSATETAPGHATLGTGALPRDHGIVGNDWVEHGKKVYATGDESAALLNASTLGMSPTRLLAETVGDVLARERPTALVRSVSEKDRAAILMNGKKGVAYWLEDGTGTFVSSQAYLSQLPGWVESLDARHSAESYRDRPWELSKGGYGAPETHAWEGARPCPDIGCRSPHELTKLRGENYTKAVKTTPHGDALTLAFVRELLEREPLGRDDVSDLLNLSFSSSDYIQHTFGPESREAEDNLLQLDGVLAQLFELLDERVGRGRYVVLLSADHGACESPEYLQSQGLDAGRLDSAALLKAVNEGLRARFDVGVDLAQEYVNPSLVLDETRIASLSLDQEAVEQAAVDLAVEYPGVHTAFARSALLAERGSHPLLPRVVNSTHRERSGHVYIVAKEHWLVAGPSSRLIANHGSAWPYDAHVPIVVWGTGAPAQRIARPVDPRDVAPTISALLRLPTPNKATGKALTEALP